MNFYRNFAFSLLFTYVSLQFTEARKSKKNKNENTYEIFGEIPSYYVTDFYSSYKWKK
jgi:Fe(3+) dicitrate transport protein